MSAELGYLSISEAHDLLTSKKVTAVELTQYYLDRIHQLNPKLRAVLTTCEKQALAQAKKVDAKIAAGESIGMLEGIPYTAKDIFLTKGVRTTAASKILDDYTSPYSATAIRKLKAAGAILLAKVNLDEFAQGGSTENSAYQPTKNPWNQDYVPGGTSGGSAAAVAADLGIFSLGTDTGGSIRQPAAYCGVTGHKPTYGLVSRFGVVAVASSLDTIGPRARCSQDAALVLEVIAGRDTSDSTTIEVESYNYASELDSKITKIGVLNFDTNILKDSKATLQKLNITTEDIKPEDFPANEALAAYYVINPSEISSNLERYDGIRYGSRSKEAETLTEVYGKTRDEFFGPEVKRRNLVGTYALSAGYYDAYYKKAMQVRTLVRHKLEALFKKYEVIIAPTTTGTAFKFGDKSDPVEMYKTDVLTVTANLAGIPSVSIPCGFKDGLPLGMQIMGKQGDDAKVLALADQIQRVTDWHKKVEEIKV